LASQDVFKARRRNLIESVDEDSVLVSEPIHVYYLTGLKAALEAQSTIAVKQNPIFLGISKNGSTFLVAGTTSLANPLITDELVFDSRNLFEGNLWTYGDYNLDERVSASLDFVAEELSEVMAEMKSRAGFSLASVGDQVLRDIRGSQEIEVGQGQDRGAVNFRGSPPTQIGFRRDGFLGHPRRDRGPGLWAIGKFLARPVRGRRPADWPSSFGKPNQPSFWKT